MNRRILRVNQEIKRKVSEIILYDLQDPRAKWMNITRCEVSIDLHNADVFFVTFGEEREEDAVIFLNKASSYVRELLKKKIYLKYTPRLHFKIDQQMKFAEEIEKRLKIEKDSKDN